MSLNSGGRRVVVTGMGIVSCIGNDLDTVADALRASRSGIRFDPTLAGKGLRSQVSGVPQVDLDASIESGLLDAMPCPSCNADCASQLIAARDARLLSLIALGTRGDARHLDQTLDRLSSHAHLDPPR